MLVATLVGRGTLCLGGSSLASGSPCQRRRGDGFITPSRLVCVGFSEWPIVWIRRPWQHLLQIAIGLQEVHPSNLHCEVDRIPIPFTAETSREVRLGVHRCLRFTTFGTHELNHAIGSAIPWPTKAPEQVAKIDRVAEFPQSIPADDCSACVLAVRFFSHRCSPPSSNGFLVLPDERFLRQSSPHAETQRLASMPLPHC